MKQALILFMSIVAPLVCAVSLKQHGSLPFEIYFVICYAWPVMYAIFWLSDNEPKKKNKIIIIKDKKA